MELELERIQWRDCAVCTVVSYNSTRALTENFLNLCLKIFPSSAVSINGQIIWDRFLWWCL